MTPRDRAVLAAGYRDETAASVDLAERGRGGTSDLSAHVGASGGVEFRDERRMLVSLDIGQMDQLVEWWTRAGE